MAIRRILIRRDTAAAWTAANPTLASGELGGETDTGKLKLGNGSTAWNSLAYQAGVTSVNGNTGVVTGLATTNNASFTGTFSAPEGTITSTMLADGTIVNADINASAAIATTKITGWEDEQVVLSSRIFN
jgi:hypothetical protein